MAADTKKSKRILTFDLLRGYFMVSIILNHLQWYPNGLDWVALRGSLFVSAAEGFFFISGIVLGIIRGRKLLNEPFRKAALLLLNRGVVLYATSVVLMLAFTFIGWLFIDNPGLKPGIRPPDESIISVIIGALSFNYIYGWADFLRLYSVFIIISPLALWLLRKNKWHMLMAVSAGVWALFPIIQSLTGNSVELLMLFSWQFIFFAGLTVGFYWEPLAERWATLKEQTKKHILTPIISIAAITLVSNIIISVIPALGLPGSELANSISTTLAPLFNKEALSPLRLVLFSLWFALGFYAFNRYEAVIKKYLGWILIPFGQNSLYVYILHAILLFFAHLLITPGTGTNIVINALGSLLLLAIIYTAVRTKFLFKIIPR